MNREWHDMLSREGTGGPAVPIGVEVDDEEELPCPACGTRAALVEGACTDCGLQLE